MTEPMPSIHSINRRIMLGGLAAGAIAGASEVASAQQPAALAKKGPKVWLDMDQKELDDSYDQSKYAPNFVQVMKRYASNSVVMRSRVGEPKRASYGTTPIERLEIYSPKQANAPIHPKAQPATPGRSLETAQAVTANEGRGLRCAQRARRFTPAGFCWNERNCLLVASVWFRAETEK
jgi:hypothetical protein